MTSTSEISKLEKEKKIVYGFEKTKKGLENGKIKEVCIASNCPSEMLAELEKYAKLSKAKITKFKHNSEELGGACRKPFSITIIGVLGKEE